jgi:hypothetical protein
MPDPTVRTIDITPTWSGVLPLLVELATNATTVEARKDAEAELRKMARAADLWNNRVAVAEKLLAIAEERGETSGVIETLRQQVIDLREESGK